jgi:hypothetical protein
LGDIARLRGDATRSLELAEVARSEAIRLDDALQIADTKHHRFDKTLKYAIALRDVGRLAESKAFAEEAHLLAEQLRELDWPNSDRCMTSIEELRRSLGELSMVSPATEHRAPSHG